MSKVQTLKALASQRQTAAAEEIIELFERTIAEYRDLKEENERQWRKTTAVSVKAEIQQVIVGDHIQFEQQEWIPSVDPELPHIKEELQEHWSVQEGHQLQGLVKSKDDEEKAQSSQLNQRETDEQIKEEAEGEQCEESEPTRKLRVLVKQQLTSAVEEIFGLFETTLAEYETEIEGLHKLLEERVKPEVQIITAVHEENSDGGEVSGLSDVYWDNSGSDESSSDSDLEPLQKVRPVNPLPEDGPVTDVCAMEVSPAQDIDKDGTVRMVIESAGGTGRRQIQNICSDSAGPTLHARRNICDKLSAFMCLCDGVMLQHIRECTIAKARRAGEERANWDVSLAELKAFIALLYVRGAYCGKNIDVESFWSEQWSIMFFTTTMSKNRFQEIMRHLCFDQKMTRCCQSTSDKFAHLREVWDRFIKNSIACYRPGRDITVNEQLFPTKVRCPFTQYMSNKFGIRFWLAVDVDTKYILNGFPYLGKDDSRLATQRIGENVMLKLVEPFVCKGRNITTSIPLANTLSSKNTSPVGKINKDKRELKHGKMVLSMNQSKRNVHLKRKPEMKTYHNQTKTGVDILYQMAHQYTVKDGTRRWPVAAFYNVLDFAAMNAWVLYQSCMNENIPRRDFILQLAQELRAEWMASREPPRLDVPLKYAAEDRKRMTCMVKAQCKQNKTYCKCLKCGVAVCGKCTVKVMYVCARCV
ncbi:uncharacterized protein LOC108884606 isoform X1 [Lates calcarifer]|uniref:Uncharacterized protein LOC108884606 isoform X1 n=1 Tax=Lates calcarifer TaxID=8187 RepID=A0AAJ7LWR5_LATCA|nr:uncharacterized protein LOC108884606 isoform X1 [Lates calcarifer]